MIFDSIKATGRLNIHHIDCNGNTIESRTVNNLVVTLGKNFIASRMLGTTKAVMSHMAIGSGTVAPSLSDIGLSSQISNRVAFDSTPVLTVSNVTYVTTFAPGVSSGTISEAGVFNSSTLGDMLCRTTFVPVVKAALDTIIITWNINIQ